MDGNKLLPPPSVKVANRVQSVKRSQLNHKLELAAKRIEDTIASIEYRDPLAAKQIPTFAANETLWVEDELPEGAIPVGDWNFVEAPEPVYSGKKATVGQGDDLLIG